VRAIQTIPVEDGEERNPEIDRERKVFEKAES